MCIKGLCNRELYFCRYDIAGCETLTRCENVS
jgi:hypothetical protein